MNMSPQPTATPTTATPTPTTTVNNYSSYSRQLFITCLLAFVSVSVLFLQLSFCYNSHNYNPKVVRLCIASSDPIKLSSQCVLCDRQEFPLTVIGCTGYTRMKELTASLLSVRQATCLIYHCRKQLPNARPQPFYPGGNIRNPIKWLNGPIADASHHEKRYLSSRSAALVFAAPPPSPAPLPPPLPPRPIILTPYILPIGYRRYNTYYY